MLGTPAGRAGTALGAMGGFWAQQVGQSNMHTIIADARFRKPALSHGERVSRDGAFPSRRGTGEGLILLPDRTVRPKVRISYGPRGRELFAHEP